MPRRSQNFVHSSLLYRRIHSLPEFEMRLCLSCRQAFAAPTHDVPCPACGAAVTFMDGVPCYAPALAHDSPGFHPEHFARLAQLEEGHFWFRARNELIVHA